MRHHIETLNDAEIQTARPIVVCAFTNEEGARFQPQSGRTHKQ